jgi:hypothetical protein
MQTQEVCEWVPHKAGEERGPQGVPKAEPSESQQDAWGAKVDITNAKANDHLR